MASPQAEKGHMRLAHEITEALVKSNLSGAQIRAVLWVLRITYGFQKKDADTNLKAFATSLRSTKDYVKELFMELERRQVITCKWASPDRCNVSFNKDFERWSCFL